MPLDDFEKRIADEHPEIAAVLTRFVALARRVAGAGLATIEVKEGRDVFSLKSMPLRSKVSFWVAYVDARPMPEPSGYQPVLHGSVLRRLAPAAAEHLGALLAEEFERRPQFSLPAEFATSELFDLLDAAYREAAGR